MERTEKKRDGEYGFAHDCVGVARVASDRVYFTMEWLYVFIRVRTIGGRGSCQCLFFCSLGEMKGSAAVRVERSGKEESSVMDGSMAFVGVINVYEGFYWRIARDLGSILFDFLFDSILCFCLWLGWSRLGCTV